jgi:hypothetical protein
VVGFIRYIIRMPSVCTYKGEKLFSTYGVLGARRLNAKSKLLSP